MGVNRQLRAGGKTAIAGAGIGGVLEPMQQTGNYRR
jgi:hypothetical protein